MIDMKPSAGRFVMLQSPMIAGQCSRGGIITKVSGKRIYYITKDSQIEKFTLTPTAICDTVEEQDALMEFNKGVVEEMFRLQQQLRALEVRATKDMNRILLAGTVDVLTAEAGNNE